MAKKQENFSKRQKIMKTISYSERVDEAIVHQFEEKTKSLPGKIGEKVGAALLAFSVLPRTIQNDLLTDDISIREPVLRILSAIKLK